MYWITQCDVKYTWIHSLEKTWNLRWLTIVSSSLSITYTLMDQYITGYTIAMVTHYAMKITIISLPMAGH